MEEDGAVLTLFSPLCRTQTQRAVRFMSESRDSPSKCFQSSMCQDLNNGLSKILEFALHISPQVFIPDGSENTAALLSVARCSFSGRKSFPAASQLLAPPTGSPSLGLQVLSSPTAPIRPLHIPHTVKQTQLPTLSREHRI